MPEFYDIAILFFSYSFLAWLVETAVATVKEKDFRNRGFASGPFCYIYGVTAVILSVFLQELRDDALFLFLGSMIIATAVEWFTGKMLEGMKRKKWWDYSGKKYNFDGYICLQYSLLWGALGFLAVRCGNGIIVGFFHSLPAIIGKVVIWGLMTIGLIDLLGSLLSVYHAEEKLPQLLGWNQKLQQWTFRLASKLSAHIEKRLKKSYPAVRQETAEKERSGEKCSFSEIFWLFLVRYDTRADGKAAEYGWEEAMDMHFDDDRMEQIYPNAIRQ